MSLQSTSHPVLPPKHGFATNERLQSQSPGFMEDIKEVEEIIEHYFKRTQYQEHEIEAWDQSTNRLTVYAFASSLEWLKGFLKMDCQRCGD
jgi:hypothetical protein